jgi:hypothetical protein
MTSSDKGYLFGQFMPDHVIGGKPEIGTGFERGRTFLKAEVQLFMTSRADPDGESVGGFDSFLIRAMRAGVEKP